MVTSSRMSASSQEGGDLESRLALLYGALHADPNNPVLYAALGQVCYVHVMWAELGLTCSVGLT